LTFTALALFAGCQEDGSLLGKNSYSHILQRFLILTRHNPSTMENESVKRSKKQDNYHYHYYYYRYTVNIFLIKLKK